MYKAKGSYNMNSSGIKKKKKKQIQLIARKRNVSNFCIFQFEYQNYSQKGNWDCIENQSTGN